MARAEWKSQEVSCWIQELLAESTSIVFGLTWFGQPGLLGISLVWYRVGLLFTWVTSCNLILSVEPWSRQLWSSLLQSCLRCSSLVWSDVDISSKLQRACLRELSPILTASFCLCLANPPNFAKPRPVAKPGGLSVACKTHFSSGLIKATTKTSRYF